MPHSTEYVERKLVAYKSLIERPSYYVMPQSKSQRLHLEIRKDISDSQKDYPRRLLTDQPSIALKRQHKPFHLRRSIYLRPRPRKHFPLISGDTARLAQKLEIVRLLALLERRAPAKVPDVFGSGPISRTSYHNQ